MLQENIKKLIETWKKEELPCDLKEELLNMHEEELNDAFYKDLEFGTGGMRGIIGPGTNRMNIYTLRKANFGYAKFLKEINKENLSVVIAYDCRHKSIEFARESAKVLAMNNIKCYLFPKITPTPVLSFAVRYLKASGGIVVTASHNPPKYNGYKIYDSNGCQLIPELANKVIDYVNLSPNPLTMNLKSYDDYVNDGLICTVPDNVDRAYLDMVKQISCTNCNKDNFKICFTPLHGTSQYLAPKLLEEMGYNYITVKEQMVADPDFKTLVLPNPEDKRAFDLAISYAKDNDCDICVATDPDADRIGLAVRNNNNEYVLLNGNQTGALLINYLVNCEKNKNSKKKRVMFNTIVTSLFGKAICDKHNIETVQTLTGFKFIGNEAYKIENSCDKEFFFGYEESYGYVIKDFVRDKDSLQALLLCSEMACYYKNQGKTLLDILEELYQEYGYYTDDLINISLEGQQGALRIERIMNYFRNNYVLSELNIQSKEDYLLSKKINYQTLEESDLTLPKSNVVKYNLLNNSFFVLRPSGTEPKMKLYISICNNDKDKSVLNANNIKNKVLSIINEVK